MHGSTPIVSWEMLL